MYADFECILKKVGIDVEYDSNSSYTRKYQNHIPCTFACKVAFVDNKYCKEIVLYRGKDAAFKFIKSILNEYNYCKSVVKKHFNENLIMGAGENERFEMTNICWICSKLFENSDNKVRDHCHITGKYRGAAHSNCSINLKIRQKSSCNIS